MIVRITGVQPCLTATVIGFCFVLAISGCGRPIPAGMVQVRGEVRCDGEPLPEGTVMFESAEGTGSGAGRILPGGAFEAILRPGNYQVAVRSLEGAAYYDEERKLVKPKSRIPQRYESVATSGLLVTVTPRADWISIVLEQETKKK
jgi:hypothetical protein